MTSAASATPAAIPVSDPNAPVENMNPLAAKEVGRGGGNVAILTGLLIIPLVVGVGVFSDRDLEFSSRLRETLNALLHPGQAIEARHDG